MIDAATWTQISYYLELLKQEGDAKLLGCVESLIQELTHCEEALDGMGLIHANLAQQLQDKDAQLQEARETIRRVNRRAQHAEAGVRDNVLKCRTAGISLGRTLANSAAMMYASQLRTCALTLQDALKLLHVWEQLHGMWGHSEVEADTTEWEQIQMESLRILPPDKAPTRPPHDHPDAR